MPLEKPPSRPSACGPAPSDADLWTAYIDASAVPNPGRMAMGAVITAPDGRRHLLSEPCHERGCNNEAELRALMAALQARSEEHTSELQSPCNLVCRLLLEKKKKNISDTRVSIIIIHRHIPA